MPVIPVWSQIQISGADRSKLTGPVLLIVRNSLSGLDLKADRREQTVMTQLYWETQKQITKRVHNSNNK